MALMGHLHAHERRTLQFLIRGAHGGLTELGRMTSGYKTPKTQRAAAVARISSLLDSIGEVYHGSTAT